MCNVIWSNLKAWRAKMRNYQIYPYFLRDGVVLHDTGVGTVPNKQNFASTAKRWLVCDDDDVWWESKTRKMLLLPSLCQHSTLCSPSHFCLDCVLLGPGSAAYITIILHRAARPGEDEPRRPGEIFRPSFLIHQVRSGNIIWNGSMCGSPTIYFLMP